MKKVQPGNACFSGDAFGDEHSDIQVAAIAAIEE